MQQSEQINELAAALALAQAEIGGAKKDSSNPFFKSKYADLASVMDACREPLTKNGLSIAQILINEENKVGCETKLMHKSGQWISGKFLLTPTKNDPQASGSAVTYARRYALAAIVGVVQEDDDGNKASIGKTPTEHVAESYVGSKMHKAMLNNVFKDAEIEDVTIMRQMETEILKRQVPLNQLKTAVKSLVEGRLI